MLFKNGAWVLFGNDKKLGWVHNEYAEVYAKWNKGEDHFGYDLYLTERIGKTRNNLIPPIPVYIEEIAEAPSSMTDDDFIILQHLALETDDKNWFDELSKVRSALNEMRKTEEDMLWQT